MALTDFWYPVLFASELEKARVTRVELLGMPLAVYRDETGDVHAVEDGCAHRSARLSLGRVRNGAVECPYHGWRYDGSGQCVAIPTLASGERIPKAARVRGYAACERGGLIWVWGGDPEAKTDEPEMYGFEKQYAEGGEWKCIEFSREHAFDHALLIENLLDPAHVHFVHEGTISSPENAQPYEIQIDHDEWGFRTKRSGGSGGVTTRFQKPCAATLYFQFGPPSFMQVHFAYCMPIDRRRTRLLYRIYLRSGMVASLGGSPMIKGAMRVLDQDIALLEGLQKQLDAGYPPYRVPVREDAAILAYRKWLDQTVESAPKQAQGAG